MKTPLRRMIFMPGGIAPYALVLVLLAAGCATQDRGGDWGGSVDTLANGAVRVVNPSEGVWVDRDPWRLIPELALGAMEGPAPEVFSALIALEADGEGRIYALDRMANELRIFSPEGDHLRTVGQSGEGPGEYQNANGLSWLSADSLLVVDQRGGRYSVLEKDGDFVRSVPRKLTFYGWNFRGGLADGRVYELSSVRDGEDRTLVFLGTDLTTPELSPVDTVFLPQPNAPPYESFSVRTDQAGMTMGVPFAPSVVYHLDSTGDLWHGHGGEFKIFHTTLAGDTISEIIIGAQASPVSDAELDEWLAGPAAQRFVDMGGELDLSRIPDVKPFFDAFFLDSRGFLWVSVPGAPGETVFAVVDPSGRYMGRLTIPGVERDLSVAPVVRNGRLYMVATDELDVQHIHVFRIEG